MRLERIITGAAGFIGSHLCERVARSGRGPESATLDIQPGAPPGMRSHVADIRVRAALGGLVDCAPAVVVHLAAVAEAVVPFAGMPDLTDTNVQGTINVLQAFDPSRLIFASSSAVYGTVEGRPARPGPGETAAVGAYGVSKRMGEVVCRQWAIERGASVVCLRFGNVVGPRCRGLIPFLVDHALRHPDGSVAAPLRGGGRIVRDYVTVECAVESIERVAELSLGAGGTEVFNVGSGFGLTNAEVANRVAEVLGRRGYRLALDFGNPLGAGESASVVLDVSETARRLGVPPPGREEVIGGIEQAAVQHLEDRLSRGG